VDEQEGRLGDVLNLVEVDYFQEMQRHLALSHESTIELTQVHNLRHFEPFSGFEVVPQGVLERVFVTLGRKLN